MEVDNYFSSKEFGYYKANLKFGLYAEVKPKHPVKISFSNGKKYNLPAELQFFQVLDIFNDSRLKCGTILLAAETRSRYTDDVDSVEFTVLLDEVEGLVFMH